MTRTTFPKLLAALILPCLIILFLSACGGSTPTPEVIVITATFTPGAATATPELAIDTPTPEPATETPTAVLPSDTPTAQPATAVPTDTPTVVSEPEGEAVYFDPGTTIATRDGSLPAGGGDHTYILSAAANQVLEVLVESDSEAVNFSISNAAGTGWVSTPIGIDGPGSFSRISTFKLPTNSDYEINLFTPSDAAATNYNVSFEVVTPAVTGSPAETVQFASGATEAVRRGAMIPGGVKEYVLSASQGQTMVARIMSLTSPIHISINGPNSETWVGQVQGSEVYIEEVSVVLPSSGDYTVRLFMDLSTFPAMYDVSFGVTETPTAPEPDGEPESVQFAPGANTANRSGVLAAGGSAQQYVLNVAAGQIMEVDAEGALTEIAMQIASPSGTPWTGIPLAFGGSYSAVKAVALPESGNYIVTVSTISGSPATEFDISFTVVTPAANGAAPEAVRFAPGAVEASLEGALGPGGAKSYALDAAAGQTMSINTVSLLAPVDFTIVGPDGTAWDSVRLGSEVYISNASIELPSNGNYVITLALPAGAEPTMYRVTFGIE